MNCPVCSGEMWDNRTTKRNPKQPDFKCKNKQCAKAVWEQPRAGGNGQSGGNKANGFQREKWTWNDLFMAYDICHGRIRTTLGKDAPHEAVQAGVATMLITAEKLNMAGPDTLKKRAAAPKPKPAPPQPPPPPPAPPPESFDDFPDALREEDDLPF